MAGGAVAPADELIACGTPRVNLPGPAFQRVALPTPARLVLMRSPRYSVSPPPNLRVDVSPRMTTAPPDPLAGVKFSEPKLANSWETPPLADRSRMALPLMRKWDVVGSWLLAVRDRKSVV